jgi:diguanylate cyclase (GGDEF)-like protein/PAS domain S-box-containing protein
MSGRFDIRLGQQICDIFSAELGFVCSLMGENGRIVASGERAWIGSIHPIAAQIMRGEMDEYSVTLEEAAKSDTIREGINTAIDFDGVRVANFCIVGPLEFVRPLAQVVRFCVKFILRSRQGAVVPDPLVDGGSPSIMNATNLIGILNQAEIHIEARDRTWQELAELSSDWFWAQDAEFRFIGFSGTAPERLRREQSDYFGKRRWELPILGVSPEELAEHQAICERHEPFHDFEYQILSSEGVPQYYRVSGIPVFNPQGEFVGYRGIGTNVTALRIAELAIKESERKLSQIVEGSPIPTFVIDAKHRITHWNGACEKLTGLSEGEVLGRTDFWRAFCSEQQPQLADLVVTESKEDAIAIYYQKFSRSTLIVGAIETEAYFQKVGESGRWLHLTSVPLRDSGSKVIGAIETLQDITEQRAARTLLEQMALHDGLTGIANRRCFDEKINLEWKRKQRDPLCLSLLILDVDHFKIYNDTYGHPAGDRCLQRIASAIEQLLFRPSDIVARYGGEEFAVILPGSDAKGAKIVAQRILDRVAELGIPHSGEEGGQVTISIGIATSQTRSDMSLESLISSADKALYKAKQSGRNRFVTDQPEGTSAPEGASN